jgi:regulator of protease activity HflC (stomatin/prohibitin superfamily)
MESPRLPQLSTDFLPRPTPRRLLGLLGLFLIVFIGLNSYFTVDAGERGVVLRFGAMNRVADPGLGFLIPGVDKLVRISTQSRSAFYTNIDTYSQDQQSASIDVSVIYHVPPGSVGDLYKEYGSLEAAVERQLDRRLPRATKEVFGTFTATTSIAERARLGRDVQIAVQNAIVPPLVVDSVQMERISFSSAYEQSVEDRMLAEVEVLKVNQNANREKVQAEIALTRARAEAQASLTRAEADAKSILLRGEAEAGAIRARAQALADNPLMVDLIAAERWNGSLPQTMVPASALPFLTIK